MSLAALRAAALLVMRAARVGTTRSEASCAGTRVPGVRDG